MPLWEVLSHTFKHPWAEVSLASWKKYPCDIRPDVVSVDIVDKEFDEKTGVLRSNRLMITKNQIPTFLSKLIGYKGVVLFWEESIVDPNKKIMVLKGRNLSFNNLIQTQEICTYSVDPQNENWTQFKQEMKVNVFLCGFASPMEKYSLQKFIENAEKGRVIMENAITRLKWEPLSNKSNSNT